MLAGLSFHSLRGFREGAVAAKTERGVRMLNEAAATYQMFGGSLEGLASAVAVVERLKTVADESSAVAMPGLTGSMVDPALQLVAADGARQGTPALRWDAGSGRFEEATVPAESADREGLFVLGSADAAAAAKAPVEEARHVTVAYAAQSDWIWDYGDGSATSGVMSDRLLGGMAYSGPGGFVPTSPEAAQLQPPMITTPGGTHELLEFPMEVHLENPNPRGTSGIEVAKGTGDWHPYDGGSISVDPGDVLRTRTHSVDPDAWKDSLEAEHYYAANPVDLDLRVETPRTKFTYEDLGGAMMDAHGNAIEAGEAPVVRTVVTIANLNKIPAVYQGSDVFEVAWQFGEGDPRFGADVATGSAFAGGFVEEVIGFTLDDWGNRTELPLSVKAISRNGHLVSDSEVETIPFEADIVELPAPLMSPEGGIFDLTVTVTLAFAEGSYPAGSTLVYTVDGSEPTIANGTTYAGPFEFSTVVDDKNFTVRAVVVPPAGWSNWFESHEAQAEFKLKGNNGHGNNEDGVDGTKTDGTAHDNKGEDPSGGVDDEIVK